MKSPLLPLALLCLAIFNGLSAPGGVLPAPATPTEAPLTIQDRRQTSAVSSPPRLRFDRLSAAEGLSFSLTTSILQDQRGFMWFGTRYGLDKYDGNNFTIYLPGPSGDVMGGNYILEIYQDRAGDFWMSTSIDLVRWKGQTGEFIHYAHDPARQDSLTAGRINTIGEDASGALWVGTNSGLNRFDPATETFSRFSQAQAVFRLYTDHQGGIWLGTSNGLWHYGSGSLEQPDPAHYQHDPGEPASLSQNEIYSIYEDHQGAVWVGTLGGGLNRLDRASGRFTHYLHDPDDPYSLSDDEVYALLEDDRGRLWIGTMAGLNLLDRPTGHFFQYHFDPGDPHSLSNDGVTDLYQDRAGVVWIATLAGICKVNETASSLTLYQQDLNPLERTLPGLSDNQITSIYQDSRGILWVGTSQGGLNRLERSTGRVTVYRHDPADPTSLSWGEVTALFEDKEGTFWVGNSSGLHRFDPQAGTFQVEAALRGASIGAIIEDQQGSLWIGTWAGLARRAPGDSAFTIVPLGDDPSAGRRIQAVYVDYTGALWVATQNDGLFRLDPAPAGGSTPTAVHFSHDSGDPQSPGSSPVMGFYEDGRGALWLGTVADGLVRFDRDTQTFTHFLPGTGPDTGLANYVGCILEDAQGHLWMGTALGLARFDPQSESFSYFDARDGLEVGEIITCFQGRQGEMFFGSWSSGLLAFFPEQLRDNPHPPAVVITALNLRNQALRTDLSPEAQIQLDYRENYLSFDFAALDYTASAKNQYAYKMEGLDADWIEAGARRHADYPDLKPGSYTFRVKAANNSGVWNEQGAAVRITITPPFWQTGWFLGLLGVAVVGAIAGGLRLRVMSVEARSRDLERQVTDRTSALEQKTSELQQRTLEIERRRQEVEALLSADDRMQRCLHQDQVLQALVDVAVDILHADKSAVIWWDEPGEKLAMRVARGFSPGSVAQFQFSRGQGIIGWVVAHREPALVEDAVNDPRRFAEDPHIVEAALAEGMRSFIHFPIIIGETVVGVFSVIYEKVHAIGEGEQRLFQALVQRAALQLENARLYEKSQELAVLEERSRLARELHDAVTQTLFSASLVAEALPTAWEEDPQEGRGLLQELRGLSRGALAEMRALLLELRPAALAETPLVDLLRQLGEAASGKEGIPVSVRVDGPAALPPEVHIALYRITQEALNNVVKHARARHAWVRLDCTDGDRAAAGRGMRLAIGDDGRGFDPAQVPPDRLGLGIMQERAQAIGASLTVASQLGQGTQVTVIWKPAPEQEAL